MRSLSRDEVRSIDRYAIETMGIPGVILMENAGRNAADAIDDFIDGAAVRRIAIVAGAGNNGGDGFVIARHLHMRGARVSILLTAPQEKIAGDAEANLRAARALEIPIRAMHDDAAELAEVLRDADLIVDAVGGTGIQGALRGSMADVVKAMNAAGAAIVAVDIPTGLDCDTGKAEGPAVKADLTVTFAAMKKGYDEPASRQYTGKVVLVDIGIPAAQVFERARKQTD